ncbi:hypothetical protein R3P38DRAFT_2848678 [Favolaschia claudopus]|uniref:Integrase core domain-containing protein n=1 Tax=Favolaschia claudopus TaxID=2862362 RepID=A0AAW0DW67_9AGAR
MSFNRNPSGKNQHRHDEEKEAKVSEALKEYHRRQITNYDTLSALLKSEHQIEMSATTVKRRKKQLGLFAAKKTMQNISTADAEQLVIAEMDKDPAKRFGLSTIKAKVAYNTGTILARDFVSQTMHEHDSEAFANREPTAKKIFRTPKYPVGIHQRWAGDGHDKLYKIGYPVWAMVDDATAKTLKAWVCPSNRLSKVVVYMFLCLVEKYGGMPRQVTTDCGAETTELFAVVNMLRNHYHPQYDAPETPAHVYLRSVHNVSVERSWFRLRLDFGDNAVLKFVEGSVQGWYQDDDDKDQLELSQFLWSRILQAEVDETVNFRNGAPMRSQPDKPGPSGMSRDVAFALPESWGGINCLLPIPVERVRRMKADLGGDALLEFTEPEFTARAQAVLDTLQPLKLTLDNGWTVFRVMLPLVFPHRIFPQAIAHL